MELEKITCEECLRIYNIEIEFLHRLDDSKLLRLYREENTHFVLHKDLGTLEQMARWHYEMDINFEGIEVISSLLEKIKKLQMENRKLIEEMKFIG